MADGVRSAFGDFLRSRRERLRPEDLGLPMGRSRRTAGLRRQEVAERAGIGIDWYIRLEQGRAVSPSPATIAALCRALCLEGAEAAHLAALANQVGRRRFRTEAVPAGLRLMVEQLNLPAYVTGRRWDILAWNAAAEAIFGFSRLAVADRNVLICTLTLASTRRLFGPNWASEAKRMVAEFRVTHDFWAGDPAFMDLLARLDAGCPEFAAWWEAHDVGSGGAGRKRLYLPDGGEVAYDYTTFQANADPGLKLAIYTEA